tara:strand:- start:395 stop:529 length:135 start_codon:yes stop_codon:yes gene_type:complete
VNKIIYEFDNAEVAKSYFSRIVVGIKVWIWEQNKEDWCRKPLRS